MANTTITVELSPDIFIAIKTLSSFYRKSDAEIIEMGIESLASHAKTITETVIAMKKGGD